MNENETKLELITALYDSRILDVLDQYSTTLKCTDDMMIFELLWEPFNSKYVILCLLYGIVCELFAMISCLNASKQYLLLKYSGLFTNVELFLNVMNIRC